MRSFGRHEIGLTLDAASDFGFVALAAYTAMVKAAPPASVLLGVKEESNE